MIVIMQLGNKGGRWGSRGTTGPGQQNIWTTKTAPTDSRAGGTILCGEPSEDGEGDRHRWQGVSRVESIGYSSPSRIDAVH
jgi:hypothetical protein